MIAGREREREKVQGRQREERKAIKVSASWILELKQAC